MRYGPAGLALKLEINLIPAHGIYPAECNEGVYPEERSEDFYPTEQREGVVAD
jgi:hypothetical protein